MCLTHLIAQIDTTYITLLLITDTYALILFYKQALNLVT